MSVQIPHPILQQLVELDTLKTWSLIVTLFGDLEGDELSGTQIRFLLGHIGIKPEAIRVALHRLKSDGWITSTKKGREAIYQMSPMASAETEAVAPDVYRERIKPPESWTFHLVPEAHTTSGIILLNKNLALVPVGAQSTGPDALVLNAHNQILPQWIARSLVSEHLIQRAARLIESVDHFRSLESHLDKLAFRLLVLHHWRRMALRAGAWAHASFFPDGRMALCHARVMAALAATDRPSSELLGKELPVRIV